MGIKGIRLEVWVDSYNRNVAALHLDLNEGDKGLKYIWFVLEETELHGLGRGTIRTLEDGYHKLNISGESCLFYDLDCFPREDCGILQAPFFRIDLHKAFWRYLEKIARYCWREQKKADEANKDEPYYYSGRRIEIQIPLETLARFQRRYGHAKGRVEKRFSDRLLFEMGNDPILLERVKQVEAIALGYSRSFYHTAIASISNDGDSYYFATADHLGRRGLNGGIIRRPQNDGSIDWSMHT